MTLLDPRKWTAIDIESSGTDEPIRALQPWSPHGFLRSTAVAQYSSRKIATAATAPRASEDDIVEFAASHIRSGRVMVGWNVAFDAAWFIARGLRDEVMTANCWTPCCCGRPTTGSASPT